MKTDLVGQKVSLCYGKPQGKPRSIQGIIRCVVQDEDAIMVGIELLTMDKGAFIERRLIDVEIFTENYTERRLT